MDESIKRMKERYRRGKKKLSESERERGGGGGWMRMRRKSLRDKARFPYLSG